MIRALFILLLFMIPAANGKVVFEGLMQSEILQTDRMVRIYLPPSYDSATKQRYPVLYLHDGQNTFSTAGPHAAFGWGSWMLDQTVDELSKAGKMREIIMVALDCTKDRYREYRGPRTNSVPLAASDPYAVYTRFLIEELKPRIDREYRTLPQSEHTALMGSSMGGICSLALAWENPETFGGAASLSGAFQVERQGFCRNVLAKYKGKKKPIRVYLDCGVVDYSGGDDGLAHTTAVAKELQRIGWRKGKNFQFYIDEHPLAQDAVSTLGYPEQKAKEAAKSQHNELYWRLRAWRPLIFLFPPENPRRKAVGTRAR